MRSTILDGSHDFFTYQKYRLYRNNGSLRGHRTKKSIFQDLTPWIYTVFYGDFHSADAGSIAPRKWWIISIFSKYRFFDFFLDWSPGSKNVPQACRDLPGRCATLPDPENRPKTSKNAILFENYFFNCWRQFLFLTAFKHYLADLGIRWVYHGDLRGIIWATYGRSRVHLGSI